MSELIATDYKITATNSAGTSSLTLTLSVDEPELLAPKLTQTELSTVLTVGDTFLSDMMNQGGLVSDCETQPALPAGLSIDVVAGSCVINGAPIVVLGPADYEINAINDNGNDNLSISLEVLPQPPEAPAFELLGNNFFSWQQGSSIALIMDNNGGNISRCTVAPALPIGLSFIQQGGSCAILGTIGQGLESTNYLLTGSNASGTTSQNLVIEVSENTAYRGDGPDPAGYDHVVVLAENRSVGGDAVVLHTDINDSETILQVASSGFPNRIQQVQTSNGELLTDTAEIDRLFRLYIDPATGIVEIQARKAFDFERDSSFYGITLQLGNETVSVLLRLYNEQKGTAAEPLFVSTFDELVSFLEGQFVSDNVGFDLINLSTANREFWYVKLDRDIDASSTKQAGQHWPGYSLKGQLDGGNHIVSGLKLADGKSFVSQSAYYERMNILNIGFTGVETNSPIINGNGSNNITEGVFVEGVMGLESLSRVTSAPFRLTGKVRRVYSNMYISVGEGRTKLMNLGAFSTAGSSTVNLYSGYSNGRVVSDPTKPMGGSIAGYQIGTSTSVINPAQFISAVQLDVHNPVLDSSSVGLRISGFGSARTKVAADTWRFIKDRNNSTLIRHVGNYERDLDNDGIADASATGPNWESAGLLEADAKSSSQYTGAWLTGDFDLTEGYIPVLKNMPYPHIHGASWMNAADPGVAYQHNMYDFYLEDPRNP